ncbi:MAG: hypothetical protein EU530_08175 [Promethearchaeota archaeon]|nr:MAG: hypothetical protein EU530_08175 [Candidatus Lokiarchaeota archaeon]
MDSNQKEKRRKIWGGIWYSVFILYFLNMLVVTVIILLMRPMWYDINEFLIGMIGTRFGWLTLILSFIFLTFAHSVYLVVFGGFKLAKYGKTHAGWGHKIIPFVFLPVWDFAINLLFSEAGSEIAIVRTQLEYFSPLFWLILIIGASAFAPTLLRKFLAALPKLRQEEVKLWQKGKIVDISIITIVFCITIIGAPFILIPSTVVRGDIPPKPILMAHRGASHLAPENTLEAAEQALVWGADGVEVDLTISFDGTIILCHDDTLRRTTNVAEVFPGRENDHVTSFTLAELRSLDAGSWFVDSDPFQTIKQGHVNDSLAESYRGILIPTLEELINFTRDNGMLLDIDSKGPPSGHPFWATYNDILFTQLNNSGMGKDILWSSTSTLTNNMTYVTGPDTVEELISKGTELVNTHHGLTNEEFRDYEEAGIPVMCWTVDSVSRFSQLWCLGVDYIKTNNLHLMGPLTKPIWSMKSLTYIITWIIVILVTPTLSFTIDYIVRKKSRKNHP